MDAHDIMIMIMGIIAFLAIPVGVPLACYFSNKDSATPDIPVPDSILNNPTAPNNFYCDCNESLYYHEKTALLYTYTVNKGTYCGAGITVFGIRLNSGSYKNRELKYTHWEIGDVYVTDKRVVFISPSGIQTVPLTYLISQDMPIATIRKRSYTLNHFITHQHDILFSCPTFQQFFATVDYVKRNCRMVRNSSGHPYTVKTEIRL